MIKITDLAKEKVLAAMEADKQQGKALRIVVENGGTPKAKHGLLFDDLEKRTPDDIVIDAGGFMILVESKSASFIEGVTIDYVSSLQGSGFKIAGPAAPAQTAPLLDSAEARTIQKLIDEKINPGVAGHGGHVSLVDVRESKVYLRLGGGCQGCGMVNVTLKQGIEVMIKQAIPTIKEVYDVTDHAGGKNPYYQPDK